MPVSEIAKSGRSTCRNCGQKIQKGRKRIRVYDDREFKRAGGYSGGHEGSYRGYIETGYGTISIQKYWVHPKCYKPLSPLIDPFDSDNEIYDPYSDQNNKSQSEVSEFSLITKTKSPVKKIKSKKKNTKSKTTKNSKKKSNKKDNKSKKLSVKTKLPKRRNHKKRSIQDSKSTDIVKKSKKNNKASSKKRRTSKRIKSKLNLIKQKNNINNINTNSDN